MDKIWKATVNDREEAKIKGNEKKNVHSAVASWEKALYLIHF